MAMTVINNSRYETRDLRRLFAACVREVQLTEDNPYLKRLRVTVRNCRAGISGYAYYNSNIVLLRIPSLPPDEVKRLERDGVDRTLFSGNLDPARVAEVFIHELGHCLGKKHRRGLSIEHLYVQWIKVNVTPKNFPLRLKAPPAKTPKPDIILRRYEQAIANLKRADTRLKRAKTLHAKWKDKVRYYEASIAAKKAAHRAKEGGDEEGSPSID